MNEHVTVSLYGGLGNQLFQYATGLAVAMHADRSLILDLSWFKNVPNIPNTTIRKYALAPFKIDAKLQESGLSSPINLSERSILHKIFRRLRIKANGQVFTEKSFRFDPEIFNLTAPIWLNGYWQSYRYFDSISDEIRNTLQPCDTLNPGSLAMLSKINTTDAICVHVRRGDYVTNKQAAETHGLCDLYYYRRGIQITAHDLLYPHCFVFSDDPEWVRENFEVGIPKTVVDVNGPDEAHQDLWLMAKCKRFVIANSSLSWWGAYLGEDPQKVVVAPKKWFVKKKHDTVDLIPKHWQCI